MPKVLFTTWMFKAQSLKKEILAIKDWKRLVVTAKLKGDDLSAGQVHMVEVASSAMDHALVLEHLRNEPSAASTVLQPSTAFIGHELVMESETDQRTRLKSQVIQELGSLPQSTGHLFLSVPLKRASELALKYQKTTSLPGILGDKTFAWCEETHFDLFNFISNRWRKSNSESFYVLFLISSLGNHPERIELAMACFLSSGEKLLLS
ncbi:hypothetical protein HPP92_018155 [Vanilla planifolia]|uniref:Uncharacterized protein n=1 Tax=Vanilla planifolia TaxID=51239 RepID=A0A835Q986_VANPL|nr:hypothetical protein HPP92_018155 [Vanilla planifolia]